MSEHSNHEQAPDLGAETCHTKMGFRGGLRRIGPIATHLSFWVVAVMVLGVGVTHYLPSLTHVLLPNTDLYPGVHTLGRILLLIPVTISAFSFGRTGGIITLGLTILVMLPRALWFSDHPVDATTQTLAVSMVGYLMIRLVETEEREATLRQEPVARMRSFNAMCSIVAKSLELDQVLNATLDKATEVTHLEVGWMCTVDNHSEELVLRAHRAWGRRRFRIWDAVLWDRGFVGALSNPDSPSFWKLHLRSAS